MGAVMRPCLAGKGLMQKSKPEMGTVVGETGIRTRYRGEGSSLTLRLRRIVSG